MSKAILSDLHQRVSVGRDPILARMQPSRNLGPLEVHSFVCAVCDTHICFVPHNDPNGRPQGEAYISIRPLDGAPADSAESDWLNVCAACATKAENDWLISMTRVRTTRPLYRWENPFSFHAMKRRASGTGLLADAIRAELEGPADNDGQLVFRIPLSHLDPATGKKTKEMWAAPATLADDQMREIYLSIEAAERKRSLVARQAWRDENPISTTTPTVEELADGAVQTAQRASGSLRDRSKETGRKVEVWAPDADPFTG